MRSRPAHHPVELVQDKHELCGKIVKELGQISETSNYFNFYEPSKVKRYDNEDKSLDSVI